MKTVDIVYGAIPRHRPGIHALRACHLISHRGEHDNRAIFENTLDAFRAAAKAGVWGLEADIRWSRDLVPLVVHDADGERLFGDRGRFAELDFPEIRQRMPRVPTLQELVGELGGRMHLMLEIKAEYYPRPERQKDILASVLQELEPGADYHFMALDTALFERVDFVSKQFCFPVAEFNVSAMSAACLVQGYGGLTGHYLLLNRALQARHKGAGQRIGTGFPASRNCLFRELNRGVEWVFSNDAIFLQACVDAAIDEDRLQSGE